MQNQNIQNTTDTSLIKSLNTNRKHARNGNLIEKSWRNLAFVVIDLAFREEDSEFFEDKSGVEFWSFLAGIDYEFVMDLWKNPHEIKRGYRKLYD